ncbi:hypothetical protein KsCSTR_44900 [Candidatus Kuenenia stuttgartiensis]|uniref:Uncharacterized protein n=1 Tax=Kuenenia stuttgartiensis TaxID=174633 RepID=Q1PWP7_KUEST|nr:hypothetical protein KsCSTR_44900 [Candidatus Kuenenia stuttgartiensis]CAJ71643.1 unknown protein [Candidatus Kuenenia stuttgartiensis]
MSPAGGGAGGGLNFYIDSTTPLFMKTILPLFPTLRRQFHTLNPPPAGDRLATSLAALMPLWG